MAESRALALVHKAKRALLRPLARWVHLPQPSTAQPLAPELFPKDFASIQTYDGLIHFSIGWLKITVNKQGELVQLRNEARSPYRIIDIEKGLLVGPRGMMSFGGVKVLTQEEILAEEEKLRAKGQDPNLIFLPQ